MSIRKTLTAMTTSGLITLALTLAPQANAATRQFLNSFGPYNDVSGIAVNLETENVYIAANLNTIYITGPTGGAPLDGTPTRITGVEFSGYNEGAGGHGIAVDNSCYEHQPRLTGQACEEYDPAYGDIYASGKEILQVFKLNAGHQYELVNVIAKPSKCSCNFGLAVDPRGDLFLPHNYGPDGTIKTPGVVTEFKKIVEKIKVGGSEEVKETLQEITISQNTEIGMHYVAADGVGDLYIGGPEVDGEAAGYHGVAKLKIDEDGHVLSEEILVPNRSGTTRPLTVNQVTDAVYVGNNSEIEELSSSGGQLVAFGSSEPLGGSLSDNIVTAVNAIAVDGETDHVYVSNRLHEDVDVFGSIISLPVIKDSQPPAIGVTRTSAVIDGEANPESNEATCYFEYVSAEEYEPAAEDPDGQGPHTATQRLSGGSTPQLVERVALTGLAAGTQYHYRMVVTNGAGTVYGPDETFTTTSATPPNVITGPASEVTSSGAVLAGTVLPHGLSTSYAFEIGGDTSYRGAKLFGDAGSSTGEVPVAVSLAYLTPGTTYHYRLVATSFDGTSYGQDGTFTTTGIPSSITQPPSAPLLESPTGTFPSIAAAITRPLSSGSASGSQKALQRALRVCRRVRTRTRRSQCEGRARKRYAPKTKHKGGSK